MWVDIFPAELQDLPPPVDISLRQPKTYELRIIIYDVRNIVSSERKPDVFIEASIPELESSHTCRTDVHRNVTDAVAKFNYRLVFGNLQYYEIERKFGVSPRKKVEPQLMLKMLDKNLVSNQMLGSLVLPLAAVPVETSKKVVTKDSI